MRLLFEHWLSVVFHVTKRVSTHFRYYNIYAVIIAACGMSLSSVRAEPVTVSPYASVLLRYENDTAMAGASDRERLRATVRAGVQGSIGNGWRYRVRVSTGLKNRQNVPAITLYRFTEQGLPDKDVYVDQAYVEYQHDDTALIAGKIPWQLTNSTDVFWDRDLHPIGAALHHQVSDSLTLTGFWGAPLDGASGTIGSLQAMQATWTGKYETTSWTFAPWLVNYEGQQHCQYACRQTGTDHTSLRLSTWLSWQQWRIALDAGHALTSDGVTMDADRDDRTSLAVELRYGKLKDKGDFQAYLRLLHVEKLAVIEEFAQNATGRLATTNYNGIDVRARYSIRADWWVGTRFSHLNLLEGEKKHANRFRIETQYRW